MKKLLALTDCYVNHWNSGWDQEQKQSHKAALCMLLPALDEEWERIKQEILLFVGSRTHEALVVTLFQQRQQLNTAEDQVSSFLVEILTSKPKLPSDSQETMYSASVFRTARQQSMLEDGQELTGEVLQVDEGPL